MGGIKIPISTPDLADSKARNYKDFTLHANLDFLTAVLCFGEPSMQANENERRVKLIFCWIY